MVFSVFNKYNHFTNTTKESEELLMKKFRCFVLCLLLSCQAATSLFPVFQKSAKPVVGTMEENPFLDMRGEN